ncbi:MAG: erythromycin esterase family protein [Myxococcota bacterium]
MPDNNQLLLDISHHSVPFDRDELDYGPIADSLEGAQYYLIGEASHGTHEFYRMRAELTQELIERGQCDAVLVEADWPDMYRANRYVRHQSDDSTGAEALSDFERFPRWMWRNEDVVSFLEWLRDYNEGREYEDQVGIYGFDLYSMHTSMNAVIEYLDDVDSEAASRARERYGCFDHYGDNPQAYGMAASSGMADCEDEVVEQLLDLQSQRAKRFRRDGILTRDEHFFAEQNARVARNAEQYYRSMFRGRESSWNLRDQHMSQTVDKLTAHLAELTDTPKVAIWAHNSHLGDARATDMSRRGEHNVGQLLRQKYGSAVKNIGFTTWSGTVTAASDWGAPEEFKTVNPALPESYERLFHQLDEPNFFLDLSQPDIEEGLAEPMLERAIGVIYRPETERQSHYFGAKLSQQFDAVIHIDQSSGVVPLEQQSGWSEAYDTHDLPETYPFGV